MPPQPHHFNWALVIYNTSGSAAVGAQAHGTRALAHAGSSNRAFTLCRGCSAAPRPGIGPGSPPAKSPIRSRVAPRAAPSRRLLVVDQLIVRAAASRVPLRRRAPELVTSPPGSPAHAQSLPSRLPPRRPAPPLIPGRVAAIAPGRPAPVGTPRRGNFLLLYTSGRGAAFRRGQGVVNAPRYAPLWDAPAKIP